MKSYFRRNKSFYSVICAIVLMTIGFEIDRIFYGFGNLLLLWIAGWILGVVAGRADYHS
ncbi:hypothetical protein [Mechercharimyces sp. CAU 1602]|uniref:hypothetical protein n=1 Tax=Mechercharimyces sp. CAU 1602 TaxID=2973933 RepID=UPI0021623462|nr:hypothetical protein [Mechercharimyces sp. CAU 1602]MCS1350356.1 hypothetical protein [Mechercharimyces sp. CAU 1602]